MAFKDELDVETNLTADELMYQLRSTPLGEPCVIEFEYWTEHDPTRRPVRMVYTLVPIAEVESPAAEPSECC